MRYHRFLPYLACGAVLGFSVFTFPLYAQPANDTPCEALPIANDIPETGDTSDGATTDGQNANCGPSNAPGVWYKFENTGEWILATTCNAGTGYDTRLSVFKPAEEGGDCETLECVAHNDDDAECPTSSSSSSVQWEGEAGTTYYILVHGYATGPGVFPQESGNFSLTVKNLLPVAAPAFTYGFEGSLDQVGCSEDTNAINIDCVLSSNNNPSPEEGIQSYSLGVRAEGGTITAITITGTDARGLVDGGFVFTELAMTPPSREICDNGEDDDEDGTVDCDDTDCTNTTTCSGILCPGESEGAVAAVIMSLAQTTSLPTEEGEKSIATVTVETRLPDDDAATLVTLEYCDGLVGSGRPVENVVTWSSKTYQPVLTPTSFNISSNFDAPPAPGVLRGDGWNETVSLSWDNACISLTSVRVNPIANTAEVSWLSEGAGDDSQYEISVNGQSVTTEEDGIDNDDDGETDEVGEGIVSPYTIVAPAGGTIYFTVSCIGDSDCTYSGSVNLSTGETGFSSYIVRRVGGDTDEDGEPDTIEIDGVSENSYIDTEVVNGTTYTYTVSTRDSCGNESSPSNEISTMPFFPGAGPFIRGDSNGDETIDISDPSATLSWLFLEEGNLPCMAAADSNGDGSVNISDPTYTLGYLFLGEGSHPDLSCKYSTNDGDVDLGCEIVSCEQ